MLLSVFVVIASVSAADAQNSAISEGLSQSACILGQQWIFIINVLANGHWTSMICLFISKRFED